MGLQERQTTFRAGHAGNAGCRSRFMKRSLSTLAAVAAVLTLWGASPIAGATTSAPARPALPAAELALCTPEVRAVIVADEPALARRFADEVGARIAPLCRSYGQPVVFDSPQRFLQSQLSAQQQALLASGRVSVYIEQGRR